MPSRCSCAESPWRSTARADSERPERYAGRIAGVLPVCGVVIAAQNSYSPPVVGDIPLGWLALLGLGLPLAIAVVSWLVPPRHPELTRRTAMA